jgi:hypothetical protein
MAAQGDFKDNDPAEDGHSHGHGHPGHGATPRGPSNASPRGPSGSEAEDLAKRRPATYAAAIRDDYEWWHKSGESDNSGKLLLISNDDASSVSAGGASRGDSTSTAEEVATSHRKIIQVSFILHSEKSPISMHQSISLTMSVHMDT